MRRIALVGASVLAATVCLTIGTPTEKVGAQSSQAETSQVDYLTDASRNGDASSLGDAIASTVLEMPEYTQVFELPRTVWR